MRLRKQGDEELGPVFAPMKRELLGHMAAEGQRLYPLLEQGETRDLITDARKGHAAIRRRLEELAAGGTMERTLWARRLQMLKQEIQHHATDEEGEILPAARRILDDQQLPRARVQVRAGGDGVSTPPHAPRPARHSC